MSKIKQQKLRRFLAVKEVIMVTLVGLNLLFLVIEHIEVLSQQQIKIIEVFDIATALVFLAEFGFELFWAKDRAKYVRHHWFYLFAAVPIPSTLFEELRAVRLLRLLKLLKIFAHMRYEYNTRLFERSNFKN